jgi:hypothetical protein
MKAKTILLSIYNLRDTLTQKVSLWMTTLVLRGHTAYFTAAAVTLLGVVTVPLIGAALIACVCLLLTVTTVVAMAAMAPYILLSAWAYQVYKNTIKKNPEVNRTTVGFIVITCTLLVVVGMFYYAELYRQPFASACIWLFEYATRVLTGGT